MTVGTAGNKFTYAGDGATVAFSFPRLFAASGDLRVILRADATGEETVQTIVTDYDVSGAGEPAGGTVTMASAPEAGETLVIVRRTEQRQETDYVTGGGFSAKSHEDALDKLTLMVQDLEEKVNRALKLAETTPTAMAPTLPEGEALKHLRWDGAATDLENVDVVSLGALGFTAAADNRLMKSDGTAGIQESGITVDDGDNVSGVNDLTVGNLFTSRGVDDDATGRRALINDTRIRFGATSATYTLAHIASDQVLAVSGSTLLNAGGQLILYGSSHATRANDFALRSGTDDIVEFDASSDILSVRSLNLTVGGAGDASNGILRPDTDGVQVISGGSGQAIGANVRLFGSTHASQASDIEFRTGGTVRMLWDQSNTRWDLQGTNLYGVSAITRNTTDDTLFLSADTVSTAGANIVLYGSTHSTQANDIFLRRGATSKLHYDDSAEEWNFQNLPIINVNQMSLQGTRHIHANVSDQFCVYSGGNDGPNGGNMLVYGSTHASLAGNIYLRSGSANKLNWDNSQENWNFNSNDITGVGDLTTNSGPKLIAGTGSPESLITAPTGSLYLRSDGGTGTSLYVKETGVGSTGWVAK